MATVAVAGPGFYLQTRQSGFAVHISASQEHLQRVRELASQTLLQAGVGEDTAESAQLVASELVGNAVRACGDLVPLVVEVDTAELGVWVKVHDPDSGHLPCRCEVPMNDADAESGRGLGLVDVLAPGWDVIATPTGKQIRAQLPYGEGDHA